MTDAYAVWDRILDDLRLRVTPQKFQTWFGPTRAMKLDDQALYVEVPNAFFVDWIEEHFLKILEAVAVRHLAPGVRVQFCVSPEAPSELPPPSLAALPAPVTAAPERQAEGIRLQQRCTFEGFVVGKSNQFAHAACQAVADRLASAYNPLFIYGGVGLGKTHLLHSIGNRVRQNNPMKKILYLTSETFMNQLVHAIQHGKTLDFKDRFRTADLLLIDDVQFLGGKESTQEEFFHTFNSLYDSHKQIVMTSDRAPRDIPHIEDRLISRFHWGLVTEIEPPELETRLAILRKKAEQEPVPFPPDVLQMIASSVHSNIRELEGCLARLSGLASLTGRAIDLPFAQESLRDMIRPSTPRIDIALIQRVVARHFGVTEDALKGKKRTSALAFARQVAMYLGKRLVNLSYVEIGRHFGNRDHSTVLFAVRKIEKLRESDAALQAALDQICCVLEAPAVN